MKLRGLLTSLLTLSLLGAGGWLVYDRYLKVEVPAIEYQTEAAALGRVTATVTASGTLSPVKTVEVGSQVSGRIIELMADFNSQVKKGDVIARIDPSLLESDKARSRANLMSARAGLTRAVADRDNAKLMWERTKKLAASGVASQQEVDTTLLAYTTAKATVESAQAAVSVAQAAIETADVNLLYTTIVSPIDGVVISRDVSVGQTVAASLSAPKLFLIAEDLRAMEVHTSVAESDVGQLKPEMQVRFTVDAYPNERFRGVVTQIRNAPTTTQNVVTYDAVVRVDNDQLKLRPGMTASVTFIVEDRRDVLLVPNTALRFTPSDPAIAALAPAPAGGEGRGRGRRRALEDEAKAEATPDTKGEAKGEATPDTKGEAKAEATPDTKAEATPDAKGEGRSRGGGGGRGGWGAPSNSRTVWVLVDGKPKPAAIKIGISDGSSTEVLEGELSEGAQVIVGQTGGEAPKAAGPSGSPLTGGAGGAGGNRGGGGGGGRRGGF